MSDIRFSTGLTLLDLVVGGGEGMGYPTGKIVNIVGDSSSGKTFLACELIAAAHYMHGDKVRWVYDDAESGFTFDTEKLYGFKVIPDEETRVKSRTVEKWACNYRTFLDSLEGDQIGIYVLDTLDGLSSRQIHEQFEARYAAHKKGTEYKKGSFQMEAAKFLSQEFFKELTALTEEKNVLLVVISQVRDKIGSLFPQQERAGGKALDFYAHTALWLAHMKDITRKERPVGVVVKARTKKSKTPRPRRSCFFTLLFDYGADNTGSNLDFLFNLRTEQGELSSTSKSIQWSEESKEVTPKVLVQFIKEHGKEELFKEAKKERSMEGIKSITSWIFDDPELKSLYEDEFGISMGRGELINWIEENGKQEELASRVSTLWESIEQEIRTKRLRKYSV
jgi:recombination protein RecA